MRPIPAGKYFVPIVEDFVYMAFDFSPIVGYSHQLLIRNIQV